MIGKQVVGSDAFKNLSTGAQALYAQLVLEADDDGFIASANSVIASNKRYKRSFFNELVSERFVLVFSSGVCVIKHWLIMNSIRKDRYRPTAYQKERENLVVKPNLSYTEKAKKEDFGNQMATNLATKWQPTGCISKENKSKENINKIDLRVRAGEDLIDLSSDQMKILEIYMIFNPTYLGDIPAEKSLSFLDRHTLDDFSEAIRRAEKSGYLTGKTGAPKMKLDWILEEDNFLSVLSGKYDSWEEEPEKAPSSFDAEEFFRKAVAKGRTSLESKE